MGFCKMSTPFANETIRMFFKKNIYTTGIGGDSVRDITRAGLMVNTNAYSNYTGGRLIIYRGTVPTDFSALTSYNAVAADALVVFVAPHYATPNPLPGINAFEPSNTAANPANISTVYSPAAQSGVATWFWWMASNTNSSNVFSNTDNPVMSLFGTVGVTGSGADLTIPNTNIVAGNSYRIFNWRLQFPSSWTF